MDQTNRIPEFIAKLEGELRAVELAAAERIRDGAKNRVPVDPNAETHLKDAIHVDPDEEGVWVVAGNKEHWFGHMVEHGTTHSGPEPFLIPAVEENTESFVSEAREVLRRNA